MVSKGMERVITLLKKFQNANAEPSVEAVRKGLDQIALLSKIPKDIECEPVDINGIDGEWIRAPEADLDKVLLYLHGGGFIAGSIDTHRDLVSRISRAANISVLIIDYRLAPEHPFPAGLEDAFKTYQWLLSKKNLNAEDIIIGGDSAGGGFTLSVLIKARDEGLPLPAAAICISPATDLAGTGDTYESKAKLDPFLSPELVIFMRETYLQNTDPKNPLASPLFANLHGLPPIYIQVGTAEILFDDSKRIAKKLESADIEVELDIWEDMIHVFAAFAAIAPEGKKAIENIAQFIKKHI
ncbi:MAG: alpha/beta hydrolase [Promethearchaeia archaeon]